MPTGTGRGFTPSNGMTWSPSEGFGGLLMSPTEQLRRRQQGGGGYKSIDWMGLAGKGGAGRGGMAGAYPLTAQGLFDLQRTSNEQARSQNQANYDEAKGYLMGITPRYAADPMTIGARGLAAGLMANPEAMNDETQQKMINRAKAITDAQANAQMAQGRNVLSSGGQLTTGNLQALSDQVARQRIAALTEQGTTMDIQRANQRNQDITNAATLGRGMGMDRAGLDLGVLQAWQLPQVMPDNYAGMAALLPEFAGGYQGRVGGGMGFGLGARRQNSNWGGGNVNGTLGYLNGNQYGPLSPGQTGVQTPHYYYQQTGLVPPSNSNGYQAGWNDLGMYGAGRNNAWDSFAGAGYVGSANRPQVMPEFASASQLQDMQIGRRM